MRMCDIHTAMKLATAPVVEPITYAQAKLFLRLANNEDQTLVEGLIVAARVKVESDTARALIDQAWDLYLDAFPTDAILIPKAPLVSVTSIKTTSAAGVQSTLDASHYQVDTASVPPRIVLSDAGAWPTDLRRTQPIVIRLAMGYGAAGSLVPSPLLRAMEQLIAHWYMHRTAALYAPVPRWVGYGALIAPYCHVELV
ncbi:MAG TPA: hypothetical protein DCQ64_20070 [Candidatus Rokubacteria bacterium]|nr:hypothetical protein [Candidatus Rokubacteria bacterium]